MKALGLVSPGKAYLPEIEFYEDFFKVKYDVYRVKSGDDLTEFDVLWYFMGTSGKRFNKNQFIVHEYASLSKPPLSKLKNKIKKYFLDKPDLRVFLNKHVDDSMGFDDGVDCVYRDMGVDKVFLKGEGIDFSYDNKVWDFIYVGAMDGSRKINYFLKYLLSLNANFKILMIGDAPHKLVKNFKGTNVEFIGRVAYKEIPLYLKKAKFGLNFIPNVFPYNVQTSTKFLEYTASGMPIISNRYEWIDNAQKELGGNIIYLDQLEDMLKVASISDIYSKCVNNSHSIRTIRTWGEVLADSDLINKVP